MAEPGVERPGLRGSPLPVAVPGERLPAALRTEALEQLLTERGLIDPKLMNGIITTYETGVGPLNGAKVVAKARTDPEYRRRLLEDGTAAIKELGFSGQQGEYIVVVENTASTHNVVVCTLCSCYPWPVLGGGRARRPARRVGGRGHRTHEGPGATSRGP
ncbi:nitrile hydratase subunit alpha [Streptomyces sp. NPDC015032]|uniref:nitrile hydratase subunit alpha n=1 Tax=Streptomyces sp. NPDC015032 TaxID=3364937 RepID=UPI0036FEAD2C